jgi:hypothetical protein
MTNKVLRNWELSGRHCAAVERDPVVTACAFGDGNVSCGSFHIEMEIHFVSSLTADDENRIAPRLLDLLCAILDQLPLAYALRIRTATGPTLQRKQREPPSPVVPIDS